MIAAHYHAVLCIMGLLAILSRQQCYATLAPQHFATLRLARNGKSEVVDKLESFSKHLIPTGEHESAIATRKLQEPHSTITQIGEELNGQGNFQDRFGSSIAISDDGLFCVVGAIGQMSGTTIEGASQGKGYALAFKRLTISGSWGPMGQILEGRAPGDRFGDEVAMSGDGHTIVIGSRNSDEPTTPTELNDIGLVQVYTYNESENQWEKLGEDMWGEASLDQSGVCIAASDDARTIAIGARYNDNDNGNNSGHVRVWKFDKTVSPPNWVRKGVDIDGEAKGDQSGRSVAMSDDGSIIAIGARLNDGVNGNKSGHVRVYKYNESGNSWDPLGQELDGEAQGDQSGFDLTMSGEGTIVAIGARLNDGGGNNAGHVRVYKLDDHLSSPQWARMGSDIDGQNAKDQSGRNIDMSTDGSTLIVGSLNGDVGTLNNAGITRIYKWDIFELDWIQYGSDVVGDSRKDNASYDVAMSGDGKTILVGARLSDGDQNDIHFDSGQASLFQIQLQSSLGGGMSFIRFGSMFSNAFISNATSFFPGRSALQHPHWSPF